LAAKVEVEKLLQRYRTCWPMLCWWRRPM